MERNYFPRGGAKEQPVIQYSTFVFERKKIPKSQRKRKFQNGSKETEAQNLGKYPKTDNTKIPHFHLKRNDFRPGFQSICAVHSIFKDRLVVNLPHEMKAYIHRSSISKLINSIDSQDLSKMFYVGQLLSCKVIDKIANDKGAKSNIKCYLTVDPSEVNWNLNSGMVKEGSLVQMAVSSAEDRGYMMESGVAGVMAFLPLQQAVKYSKMVLAHRQPLGLGVGTVVWCYVEKSNENSSGSKVIEVSVCHDATFEPECVQPSTLLQPGSRVNTTITKVFEDGCCQVSVDETDICGTVHSQLELNRDPSQEYYVGTRMKATVMTYNPLSYQYNFSFSHQVHKPLRSVNRAFKQHGLATVEHIDKNLLHLSLDKMPFKGIVTIESLLRKQGGKQDKDDRKESGVPPLPYAVGDSVKVEITNINLFTRKYSCSVLAKIDRKVCEAINSRKMKKVMSESSEYLSDDSDFDIKFEPDLVAEPIRIKEEVLSADDQDDSGVDTSKYPEDTKSKKKKSKVAKREMLENGNVLSDVKSEQDSDIEIKEENDSDNVITESYPKSRKRKDSKTNESDEESPLSLFPNPSKERKRSNESYEKDKRKKVKNDSKPIPSETIRKKMDAVSQLSLEQVDSQFLWDATPQDLAKVTSKEPEEFKEESDDEGAVKKPLTKKQKKTNEIEKERKIREKEEELMKALEEPKSADHYERLILSRPDDSRVWIKYMAFHLEATEIEKARAVGNRALKLITHRSEQDRLNVWLALLNLEHLYGSKELFKDTWTEALKFNDDYKVNCKVLDLFASSQNTLEVNGLVQRMVKQYREKLDCWLECLSALMSAGMEEKARDLVQRALKSLPTKNHVGLISRFALIENSQGHGEEAQALFDNLLTSYPTRVDLWFVYIDMLIKSNQMELTRQVLERATSLKLPAKKMKSLYKKWLDFEEKHGNEETVEGVRKSATQYVQQATKEIGA